MIIIKNTPKVLLGEKGERPLEKVVTISSIRNICICDPRLEVYPQLLTPGFQGCGGRSDEMDFIVAYNYVLGDQYALLRACVIVISHWEIHFYCIMKNFQLGKLRKYSILFSVTSAGGRIREQSCIHARTPCAPQGSPSLIARPSSRGSGRRMSRRAWGQ